MGVGFKSPLTSNNVNTAFLSKNVDDETFKNIALKDPTKGDNVDSVQQAINDGIENLSLHVVDYEAHREFDTKANLEVWALTAGNGWFAFATDEEKSYQVIGGVLAEIGGGGGGISSWESGNDYVIGNVVYYSNNKIYRCITDNSDVSFDSGKWVELSSNFLENKIFITSEDNIKYIDSESVKLLKKENGELFFEDFKDSLPSTYFENISASLTVDDDLLNPLVQAKSAKITQSSAIIGDSVEKIYTLPAARADWYLEPIKIVTMNDVSGGAGTFDFEISKSTDGVTYTNIMTSELSSGTENLKQILQLDSTITHFKMKWIVATPDDATILKIGRILISTEAFPVGQTTITDSVYWNGTQSSMDAVTGDLRFGAGVSEENSTIIRYDNTTGRFNILKDCKLNASVSLVMSTPAARYYMAVNGVRKIDSNDTPNVASYNSVLSGDVTLKSGDYITFYNGSTTANIATNALTMTATAYADNVIVDAAINGNQTTPYTPSNFYSFGAASTSNLTYTRLGVSKYMKIEGTILAGTHTGSDYSFELPSGFTVDNNINGAVPTGNVTWNAARGSVQVYTAVNAGQSKVEFYYQNDATAYLKATSSAVLPVSGATYYISAIVPVNEYSASSLPIQLDVSSERENVYSAVIDASVNKVSESSPFIQSITRTAVGVGVVVFKTGFLTTSILPSLVGSVYTGAGNYSVEFTAYTATGFTYRTFNDGGTPSNQGISITLQRQGADYRPQKAFVANAVSIVNHKTDGSEYEILNETWGGKKVYARSYILTSNITSTTTIATVDTGLKPLNSSKTSATVWLLDHPMYTTDGTDAAIARYNEATGVVDYLIAGRTVYAGTSILFKYTKP